MLRRQSWKNGTFGSVFNILIIFGIILFLFFFSFRVMFPRMWNFSCLHLPAIMCKIHWRQQPRSIHFIKTGYAHKLVGTMIILAVNAHFHWFIVSSSSSLSFPSVSHISIGRFSRIFWIFFYIITISSVFSSYDVILLFTSKMKRYFWIFKFIHMTSSSLSPKNLPNWRKTSN